MINTFYLQFTVNKFKQTFKGCRFKCKRYKKIPNHAYDYLEH